MAGASVVTLAALGLAVSWMITVLARRYLLGWFHPLAILWLLAAVDVYVPAFLWAVGIEPKLPFWITNLPLSDVPEALLFYLFFYVLMTFPIVIMTVVRRKTPDVDWHIRWRLLSILVPFCLALAIWELWLTIREYGSFEDWFWAKARVRWSIEPRTLSLIASVYATIPWRMLFNLLAFVGFYYGAEMPGRVFKALYRWVYPFFALLLSLTTFYRGSILLTVAGFVFVEFLRRRLRAASETAGMFSQPRTPTARHHLAKSRRLAVGGVALAVVVALLYGVVRDSLGEAAWAGTRKVEVADVVNQAALQMFQGAGLVGVACIVQAYGRDLPLWKGETYFDALLLPVPRAVYPSKPERPGLLKITTALGEPESTQSAVTMPGEAFANFGYWGFAAAPVLGLLFGLLYWFTARPRTPALFLYPGVVFYVFVLGNWMSLTGIMNQLPAFLWSWLALKSVFRRARNFAYIEHCQGEARANIRQTG